MLISPRRSHGDLGKRGGQPTPIPSRIEDRAHFVATTTIAIRSPMLELDAHAGISFCKKAHGTPIITKAASNSLFFLRYSSRKSSRLSYTLTPTQLF
jgi:hypothetical protein